MRREEGQDLIISSIAERIRVARLMLQRDRAEVAYGVGISLQQFQMYENGSKSITADLLYKIALFLDLPAAFFYEGLERTHYPSCQGTFDTIPNKETQEFLELLTDIDDERDRKIVFETMKCLVREK